MAGTAVVQFSMDADLKERAEALYQRMGMKFEDGLRILVEQSVGMRGFPLVSSEAKNSGKSVADLAGCLHSYVTPERLAREKEVLPNAFERMVLEKYGVDLDDTD